MSTLADITRTNKVHAVLAEDLNRLIASSLRPEYKNVETLTGDVVLTDGDMPLQRWNCNGADRIGKLPTANTTDNHLFLVVNATSSGNYKLTMQDNGGTVTLGVFLPGDWGLFLPDGNGSYFVANRPFSRVLSPSQVTANQNDWYPTGAGGVDVIRVDTDASRTFTGFGFGAAGKAILVVNKGSNPAVFANESASSSAANRFAFGADLTLASDQSVMLWYDATSSRWRVVGGTSDSGGGGGGGGLTNSVASVTTTNVTGVAGTRHILDVSGMTANRNFVLPAGVAGDEIEVNLSVGDATYALILIGDTGISINGGSAATEWSRIFIKNETVRFVATSTMNWQVVHDGRIPCHAILERQSAQSINSSSITKMQLSTEVKDIGDFADAATNYRVTIRRDGTYLILGAVIFGNSFSDQKSVQALIYIDGSMATYQVTYISYGSSNNPGMARLAFEKALTAAQYVELDAWHNQGAAVDTGTTTGYPQLVVREILDK